MRSQPFTLSSICILLLAHHDVSAFAGVGRGLHQRRIASSVRRQQTDKKDDTADALLDQAAELRREIESFESTKEAIERKAREEKEAIAAEQQARRDTYSAVVPILKPDGSIVEETVDFPPRLEVPSYVTTFESSLPLGLLLGEDEETGMIVIDEIAGGISPIGLLVGDVLRACSACKMEMTTPTWQLLAGGIGVPKTKRFMFATDGRPLEQVMEAIASNRMDPDEQPVLLVIERAKASE